VALTAGGDTDIILHGLRQRTGDFVVTSTSLGTIDCGPLAAPVGYFTAARCKLDTAIYDVTPAQRARMDRPFGFHYHHTGNDFGHQCTSCQVVAIPVNSTTQTALQVSSWTNTAISAVLPASLTGCSPSR
jgi:hypothetical protein